MILRLGEGRFFRTMTKSNAIDMSYIPYSGQNGPKKPAYAGRRALIDRSKIKSCSTDRRKKKLFFSPTFEIVEFPCIL